jgi:hypothetical protein
VLQRPVELAAYIGSNLPTRRHYFRFARDSGSIAKADHG